jgi:uncharacterized OB-fold protein
MTLLPDVQWEPTRPFWQAAARGELAIPRCTGCRRLVWYPCERCPGCAGDTLSWERVSGRGRVFSFAIVRRPLLPAYAELVPYATGLVSLDEDPAVRLVTRFVDCAPDDLRIDLPVRAVFRTLPSSALLAPFFAPAL